MTNKLNYWLLAALIPNASASTSASKGAHDDPPFMIRDLLTSECRDQHEIVLGRAAATALHVSNARSNSGRWNSSCPQSRPFSAPSSSIFRRIQVENEASSTNPLQG